MKQPDTKEGLTKDVLCYQKQLKKLNIKSRTVKIIIS